MNEIDELKRNMERVEKEMEQVKGKYEKLDQEYKQMKAKKDEIVLKECIQNLEKKVAEQIQRIDEKETLLTGFFFLPLMQLENMCKRADEYEKAKEIHEKYEEIDGKIRSKEYIIKRIKCLEEEIEKNKELNDDEREGIWHTLWDAYKTIGEKKKAEHARKKYEYLYERGCNDGDLLRY